MRSIAHTIRSASAAGASARIVSKSGSGSMSCQFIEPLWRGRRPAQWVSPLAPRVTRTNDERRHAMEGTDVWTYQDESQLGYDATSGRDLSGFHVEALD